MTVPYQFANATGNINLAELDANFDALGGFSQTAQTVIASAQPNVTSVGTLVSLGVTGNIRSVNGYLLGDGSKITNLPVANSTYGNANVATYLPTYNGSLNPTNVSANGTITTANLSVTNTAAFAKSITVQQNLQVTGNVNSYGTVIGKDFVTATGNANVVNVNANAVSTVGLTATGLVTVGTLVPTTITGNGNIFANFITANANLAVSGRITSSGVVIANQGFTTSQNVQANNVTASNAVTAATVSVGTATATGNITGGNILAGAYYYANGQPFTGNSGGTNYSNANVASFLAVNTGPINGGNLSVTLVNSNGNITGANVTVAGNVTAAGIVATNYQANANIHAGGTLTAVGAAQVGSLATNGNITGANVTVTGNVTAAGTVTATGNIAGGNILASGYFYANGQPFSGGGGGNGDYGNSNVASFLAVNTGSISGGNITASGVIASGSLSATGTVTAGGNITAAYFVGDGSQLTNIPSTYSNANVASFLAVNTGSISGGNLTVAGRANVTGNITGGNLTTTGIATAGYFVGDGSLLTNIPTSYSNANVATYLPTYSGNISGSNQSLSGALVTTGNITGSNLITGGNVTAVGIVATNYTGNGNLSVTGRANIAGATTVGSLATNGNINAGNVIATSFVGSGTQLTGISGPIFMAYNSSNSNLTNPGNVLRFSTTTVNTNNYYNTSTGVFTPLVPGYYQVNVSFLPELVSGSANASFFTGLYKNGSLIAIGGSTTVTPTWGDISCSAISTLVYLNGSSDYLGIATTNTIYSGSWRTGISVVNYFQATWVHA
jgi:hypothetical protein